MTTINRIIRLLPSLVLTMTAAICVSQVGEGPRQASHAINGQVVNSVTGEPIARARVQVGTHQAALTDHDGRFEFDNVSDDSAYAFASKPGYFVEDKGVLAQGQPITLQLIPEAILFGTITDQNGQPIQDLRVQLSMLQVRNGVRRWQTAQVTSTSVEGQFRFAELQAGQYSLATVFRIEGLVEAASSVAFLPVSFPPLTGDGIRGSLTLAPGDHVEANASPAMEKLYPVSGIIHRMAGHGGGFVETQDGEILEEPINLNPSGAFHLRLPSGSYRLKVQSTVEGGKQLKASRDISVGEAPLEGISMTLEPAAILPIEVEYQAVSTGSPNAPSAPPPYLNVLLEDEDARGPGRSFPAQPLKQPGRAQPLEPGAPMAFRDIEPGQYGLQSPPQPPWYLASASCGNVDLTRDPLVIAAGTPACTVRMVYRDDSASLNWSASAGEADNGSSDQVYVAAIPLDNLTQPAAEYFPSFSVFSGHKPSPEFPAEGGFKGLAPGRYLVLALRRQQELPYRDHEALQRYLSLGQEITLTRGGKSEVELKIVTGEP
jgi:Carboxypeptidase regulatory-like domain